MTHRDDVGPVFRKRTESPGNDNMVTNAIRDTMDGWVHAEGLMDNRVEGRELTDFLVLHGVSGTIKVAW